MYNNLPDEFPEDRYKAAFDEASFELIKIQQEFERLSLRHQRIAKVVEVLKPEIRFEDQLPTDSMTLTTRAAGLTVVTRLAIVHQPTEA